MGQEILITGATGFIGSYVVEDLLDAGHNVTAISRNKQVNNVRTICADISNMDVESVASDVEKCDVVIHLASCNEIHNAKDTLLTNTYGSYNMIQLANKLNVKKFIFLSSVPIVGVPYDLPITEAHHEAPSSEYHISKWCAEKMITTFGEMAVLIFRIPSPIGVGMSKTNYLSYLMQSMMKNEQVEVYGQGLRVQNYIDVRDVSRTIVRNITSDVGGMYLLAGEESISNIDLAYMCRDITDSKSEIIVGKKPDLEEGNRWIISTGKAKKDIGFSAEYSLKETIRWILGEVM